LPSAAGLPAGGDSVTTHPAPEGLFMTLPPLSLDLGLLLISIGVVNLWKARQS